MTAEEIKRTIDLAAFIRSRGIELKAKGRDLVGRCPFHNDTEPSLVVTPHKQLWHCMGCDKGGSVIDYVMHEQGVEFAEAVRHLSAGTPCEVRKHADTAPPEATAATVTPERQQQLLERVVTLYEKNFAEFAEGREYLESRGITDAGLYGRHRIGWGAGTLPGLLPADGEVHAELVDLGVLLDDGRERFENCVVFPVFDPAQPARIVTLYGRHTGEGAKRHVFLPDRPTGLWNLANCAGLSELYLVESAIDALSLEMCGPRNVVSIQGTNGLARHSGRTFADLGIGTAVLLLDGDEPGRKAAFQLKEKLSDDLHVRTLTLPDDHDPNSFLQAHGPPALAEFLAQAPEPTPSAQPIATAPRTAAADEAGRSDRGTSPGNEGSGEVTQSHANGGNATRPGRGTQNEAPNDLDRRERTASAKRGGTASPLPSGDGFAVSYGMRRYEVRGLEKGARKLKATVRVAHGGRLHVDTLDFYSARARGQLCRDLARVFDQDAATIEGDITRLLQACEGHKSAEKEDADSAPAEAITPADRREAEAFGKAPDLRARILADFETCGLVGEEHNKLLCYLAAVSRKMPKPLAVLILSSSGAGKTALQDAALRFCPPEDLVKVTNLSAKALFYKEELSLKHKVLAIEEGEGAEEASYAIRNLISAGELTSETAMRDPATGKLTTQGNRVEGPCAVFETTTDPDIDAETKSRFLVTHVDESAEQTRAILAFQRQRRTLSGSREDAGVVHIVQRHRTFQRLLRSLAVVNPFGPFLAYGDDRLQGRRDQPKYLNLIDAVAFLRQMAKPIRTDADGAEYVEVDEADLAIAHDLAHVILGRSLDEVSYPARQLYRFLDDLVDARIQAAAQDRGDGRVPPSRRGVHFTRRDIMEFTGWNKVRVHRYLKELVDIEYVAVEGNRAPFHYRLLAEERHSDQAGRYVPGLRAVDEVLADFRSSQP